MVVTLAREIPDNEHKIIFKRQSRQEGTGNKILSHALNAHRLFTKPLKYFFFSGTL